MTQAARHVPAEGDVLCQTCGYVLNGLPAGARCPECGQLSDDADNLRRSLPDWEAPDHDRRPVQAFLRTTAAVLLRPGHFFRTLLTRPALASDRSQQFARIHWVIASVLFGSAAYGHFRWLISLGAPRLGGSAWLAWPAFIVGAYLFTWGLHLLAARLTNWEAGYRGYRLPLAVVRRGLNYHTPHYLPVGVAVLATVVGFQLIPAAAGSGVRYLGILCAEVVLAAAYLFGTYWTAMRALLYANS